MKKFQAKNIHCQNCVNIIKNALGDEFGEIEIDLSCEPKVVSLEITNEQIENFKAQMADLGFEVIKEI